MLFSQACKNRYRSDYSTDDWTDIDSDESISEADTSEIAGWDLPQGWDLTLHSNYKEEVGSFVKECKDETLSVLDWLRDGGASLKRLCLCIHLSKQWVSHQIFIKAQSDQVRNVFRLIYALSKT
jgi:hypothetical protein